VRSIDRAAAAGKQGPGRNAPRSGPGPLRAGPAPTLTPAAPRSHRGCVIERLQEWAAGRGWSVAAGPATLLGETRDGIAARAASGELDTGFYSGWLRWMSQVELPPDLALRNLILVALPCPQLTIRFSPPGRVVDVRVPPTYGEDSRGDDTVVRELAALLPELHGDLARIRGPRKALAVRMGLAEYGRNNITYARGIGSYFVLCGVLTGPMDPLPAPPAPALRPMAACADCGICRAACPTGAIPRERFLLRAERCLVATNEAPGPWPEWARGHNALVGCMACQEACPANKGKLVQNTSGVEFDTVETAAFLARGDGRDSGGAPGGGQEWAGAPWPAIRGKLASLGLQGYERVIGRNLAALL
jgi:epoxyqueuosine reductase